MTGYGKTETTYKNKTICVEIKSLNSKQLDINMKLPGIYNEKELETRALIAKFVERGKILFTLSIENGGEYASVSINKPIAKQYYNELKALETEIGQVTGADYLSIITRLPDVLKQEKLSIDEEEWTAVYQTIESAFSKFDESRKNEGNTLELDMIERIHGIENLLQQIEPFEQSRISNLREKMIKGLKNISEEINYDENRFEQEMIFYFEKIDITEEKVRLKKHLEYFLDTIKEPFSNGKKLGFITQEIGREVNTLGSKANDVNIQKLIVQMKDELEKIKEQLMNIL